MDRIRANSPSQADKAFIRENHKMLPIYQIAVERKLTYYQVWWQLQKMGLSGKRVRSDRKPSVSSSTAFFQHDKSYWNY